MSTKIYDGVRIETDDIFAFTTKLHGVIHDVFKILCQELVMQEITRTFDSEAGDDPQKILFAAEKRWMKEQGETPSHSFLHDPLRFSFVFGRSASGQLLGNPFSGNHKYTEALMAMEEIEEYGYWNNTDSEEGVTEEEWDFRRKEWDSMLDPRDGNFAHLPMYQLSGTQRPFNEVMYELYDARGEYFDEMLNFQPSPEGRLIDKFVSKCLQTAKPEKDSSLDAFYKVRRHLKHIAVSDMGELPRRITGDDITGAERSNIQVNLETVSKTLKELELLPE